MPKSKNDRREAGWLTIGQLADALDVDNNYCRREVLRRAPPDAIRKKGRRIFVYARSAIESWIAHRIRKEILHEANQPAVDDDLQLQMLLLQQRHKGS